MIYGENNLQKLLNDMSPNLNDDECVFVSLSHSDLNKWSSVRPIGSFQESEGMTWILTRNQADTLGLSYSTSFRYITLAVHSSLEAVGLTAAVAGALAESGISANVVAAYYHDHIFVPTNDAERALAVLQGLTGRVSI